ncbi:MAG TPA: hypothetical protein PLU72_19190 [Candidatus Ozemobacteraceae bacterium]|nr:hypothetical protein [Candidatus Ozemobacteraceae bacterium]HQG27337.1 hypothetical protein [Candidatus Ozemobacteraceae bacterium]
MNGWNDELETGPGAYADGADESGVFEVVNPEGEVYLVDTATPGSPHYGPDWAALCRSYLTGSFVAGTIFEEVRSRAGEFAGYRVRVGQIRCFLPASRASGLSGPGGKTLVVAAVQDIDPNSRNVTLAEVRTTRDMDVDEVNDLLAHIETARRYRRGLRCRVLGLACNRAGQPRGMLVDLGGLEGFLPEHLCMGLTELDPEQFVDLPVLVEVTGVDRERMQYRVSIRRAYQRRVGTRLAPVPGTVAHGLVLTAERDRLLVALPRGTVGVVRDAELARIGVAAENWRDLCGRVRAFRVGDRLEGPEGPAIYDLHLPDAPRRSEPRLHIPGYFGEDDGSSESAPETACEPDPVMGTESPYGAVVPSVYYTDASFRRGHRRASFSIVGFCRPPAVPDDLVRDVLLEAEETSDPDICGFTGVIRALGVTETELMGVWACAVLAAPSIGENGRLVIYTDNLDVVHAVQDVAYRGPYRDIVAKIRAVLPKGRLAVRKVKGHAGIDGNEWADYLAKRRMQKLADESSSSIRTKIEPDHPGRLSSIDER